MADAGSVMKQRDLEIEGVLWQGWGRLLTVRFWPRDRESRRSANDFYPVI